MTALTYHSAWVTALKYLMLAWVTDGVKIPFCLGDGIKIPLMLAWVTALKNTIHPSEKDFFD